MTTSDVDVDSGSCTPETTDRRLNHSAGAGCLSAADSAAAAAAAAATTVNDAATVLIAL